MVDRAIAVSDVLMVKGADMRQEHIAIPHGSYVRFCTLTTAKIFADSGQQVTARCREHNGVKKLPVFHCPSISPIRCCMRRTLQLLMCSLHDVAGFQAAEFTLHDVAGF